MILLKCNRLCLSHMLSTPMASHLTEIKYSTLTRAPYHLVTTSFSPLLCLVCSTPNTQLPYFLSVLCMSPISGPLHLLFPLPPYSGLCSNDTCWQVSSLSQMSFCGWPFLSTKSFPHYSLLFLSKIYCYLACRLHICLLLLFSLKCKLQENGNFISLEPRRMSGPQKAPDNSVSNKWLSGRHIKYSKEL